MPQLSSPDTGYLVVEGFINSNGPTNITLSRTNKIDSDSLRHERGATISVEGDDNSINYFVDFGTGLYTMEQININTAQKYRLHIRTSDGKEYLSDYVPVKTTPPIDTVSWQYGNTGVDISASAHDPSKNTRYYNWSYLETWEYHATYVPTLKWDMSHPTVGPPQVIVTEIPYNPSKLVCWKNRPANNIFISSTAKLSEDIVSGFHLLTVPKGSQEISVLYSVVVKEYAITEDAYEFFQKMKKNTEETGSVFDAQPSELKGNIHCISNPTEMVLGFVYACSEETKRIFIKNSQVPNWGYQVDCKPDTVPSRGLDINQAFGSGLVPIEMLARDPSSGVVTQFIASRQQCVDCTVEGSNQKPVFWPQ